MEQQQIWYKKYTLKELNEMMQNTVGEQLDIKFEEIGNDFLVATMPVNHKTVQPFGLLHGGCSVVLSETLGSVGSLMAVNDNLFMGVGIEVNANHLKSVTSGWVKGICSPVKIGGKIHVWETKIVNNLNELICISRLTTAIIPKRK
jgi:1,4-dihydroxy-2-naphthoyl-CoA hydrolase